MHPENAMKIVLRTSRTRRVLVVAVDVIGDCGSGWKMCPNEKETKHGIQLEHFVTV
jgi:hypothetical protein